MNTHTSKSNITFILMILLTLIQLGCITYLFLTQKNGLFSDEIFSYSLSNSYYHPYFCRVDAQQTAGDLIATYGGEGSIDVNFSEVGYVDCFEWVSGTKYHDYLTVQPNQRFSYDSVIYNQSADVHPPLYYIMLHTICSFFPDSFSIWYAYILNIVFFIVTQIFLYSIALRISRSPYTALLGCMLYGGGAGAFCTTVFLRQYCLYTMLCVIFTWFAIKIYYDPHTAFKNYSGLLLGASLTAFLTFMTHLSSIIYIGTFTALFCLLLLFRKKYKKMLSFGFSLLGALTVFILMWPVVLSQLTTYNTGYNYIQFSYPMQFKMLVRLLCQYCFGFSITVLKTSWVSIIMPLLIAFCILTPLILFPFRHEPWCHNLFVRLKHIPKYLKIFLLQKDYISLVIASAVFSTYIVSCHMVDIYHMGAYVVRYIMPGFPLLCMVMVIWLRQILPTFSMPRKLSSILAMIIISIMCIRTHYITECPFLMPHFGETENTSDLLRDKNVVVIFHSISNLYQYAIWTSPYFINAKNVFLVSDDLFPHYLNTIEQLNEPVDYVLVSYDALFPDERNHTYASSILSEYAASTYVYNSSLDVWGIAYDSASFSTGKENTESDILIQNFTKNDCSEDIKSLNNGCTYQILCGVNAQSQLLYVLKLE